MRGKVLDPPEPTSRWWSQSIPPRYCAPANADARCALQLVSDLTVAREALEGVRA